MGSRITTAKILIFALALLCAWHLAEAMPLMARLVNAAPTTVGLQSTPNPSAAGGAAVFTALVFPSAGGQAFSNFNPPAQNPLSENGIWLSPINPHSSVALQSNTKHQVYATAIGFDSAARYIGQTSSGDQYSQATIVSLTGNTVEGVLTRIQSATDSSCYGLVAFYADFYTIVRINDNQTEMKFVQTGDSLGAGGRLADFGVKPKAGDVVRLEVSGSPNPTLKAYVNGILLGSVVDTGTTDAFGPHPPLSGGQPGIYTYVGTGQTADTMLTNWSGGNLITGAMPTGTITFSEGATVLGTGTLDAFGQGSFSTLSLSTGTHAITAAYSGDTNFGSGSSQIDYHVVGTGQASRTTVQSSQNPSTSGQALTFTANVSSVMNGLAAASNFGPPAESPLSENGKWATPVNAATTIAVQKDATNTISPTTPGMGAMARYVGQTYSPNQYAQATIVSRGASTIEGVFTRIQSNANGSSYGLVDYFGSFYTIVRMQDFGNYARFAGTSSSFGGGRIMDFAVSPHAGDVIRLEVSGSPNPTLNAYVNGTLLGTVVDSGQSDSFGTYPPLLGGQPGVFVYMSTGSPVTPQLGSWSGGDNGAGVGSSTPTGTVTFMDGAAALGTGTLDTAGNALLTTSALATGSHAITVSYGGDSTFASSVSFPLTQVVSAGTGGLSATTTTLISSLNPATSGQVVTFTATVTSGSGTPGGTVTFSDGSTTLGSAVLDGTGHAAYTTSALAVGTHSITASYGGNVSYAVSASSALSEVISSSNNNNSGSGGSQTTVGSSLNPSFFGQSVTFTATAVPTGGLQASSSFNAPAENPLSEGGNWVSPLNPFSTIAVVKDGVSNTIAPSGSTVSGMARYVGQTYSGDQFAQATISARNGSTLEGVMVRIQSNTNVSAYGLIDHFGAFYSIVRSNDFGNWFRF
ncbi:MAG TPA: Ig-like domain-containing protein, partial [Terriglobia bacterium]|nr:Ig-like domain-containing protein [Terriglobia bacterium]